MKLQAFIPRPTQAIGSNHNNKGAVRFGWFNHGHHAIDRGGIMRLPDASPKEASWKNYLLSHWNAIEAGNDMQDILYNGPNHYINLVERGNPELSNPNTPPTPPPRSTIEDMTERLSFSNLDEVQRNWLLKPMEPETMLPSDSLFNSIVKSYALVKNQLKQIADGNSRLNLMTKTGGRALNEEVRRQFYEELSANIGRLAHYVGDMFMPFHVTPGIPDWELAPGSAKGMHLLVEGEALNRKDYTTLVEQAKQRSNRIPLPLLNHRNLPYFVLDKMQDSFRNLFRIAAIHQATLSDPNATVTEDVLEKTMMQRVRGILGDQLKEAQEAVGTILYAAWDEAGRPEIPEEAPRPDGTTGS